MKSSPRISSIRKFGTASRMLVAGDFRDVMIKVNKRLGLRYLDFDKVSGQGLGIPDSVGRGHQISGWELESVLNDLGIKPEDSIVDLGSGKGGALITMAKFPFKRILGVELSAELADVARRNIARIYRQSRIDVVCSNAVDFKDFDHLTHIYLFDPFPAEVMNQVLSNIQMSLDRKPRDLTMIYNKPVCEAEVLASGLFKRVDEYLFADRAPVVIYSHES